MNSYGTYMDNICIMMYIDSLGTLFGIWEAFGNFLLGNFIFGKFGRNFFVTLYLTSVRFLQMMAGNGTPKTLGFTNCQVFYPSFFHQISIIFRCVCSSSICYLAAAADQLSSLRGGPSMSAGSASGSWDCSWGN